jgi:histo-blood group ABO system transferase
MKHNKFNFYAIFFILNLLFNSISYAENKYKIGLLVVATGKYITYVQPLVESANKYFCTKHDVTYFIFTDGQAPQSNDIITIHQNRLGWPYDTMMRFEMYYNARELLQSMDYLFACDADMLFADTVGDEILGDRVGTLHPGYVGSKGTPETRSLSLAYIAPGTNKFYFAGGFNGGNKDEFLKMAKTISENVRSDLTKGIIAIWHDESHLNKYYIDHEPTVILSPSYCYPEHLNLDYKKRLLALFKNHSEIIKMKFCLRKGNYHE